MRFRLARWLVRRLLGSDYTVTSLPFRYLLRATAEKAADELRADLNRSLYT